VAEEPGQSQIVLTRQQVREVDRLAIEQLGIPGVVLMENAGRSAATAVMQVLAGIEDRDRFKADQPCVVVLCGGGNNGGDGYVIARHLLNWGVAVTVLAAKHPDALGGDAAINCEILRNMGHEPVLITDAHAVAVESHRFAEADVIVDALLGTGFSGEVGDDLAAVIGACNRAAEDGASVVAVDVPSGLDCDTGRTGGTAVIADLTVTFVAAKPALTTADGQAYAGQVVVADIGAPPQLVQQVLGVTSTGN